LGCLPLGPSTDGLHGKYIVNRTDKRDEPGERHYLCRYFVLDLTHDIHARPALLAYAESIRKVNPELAADLFHKADEMLDWCDTNE
jgi:hypothetical protein